MISLERTILALLVLLFGVNVFAFETGLKSSGGKAPGKNLKMKSSKVPSFELHKAKGQIPRLNIGEEPELKAVNLETRLPEVPTRNAKPVQKANSPAIPVFDAKKSGFEKVSAPRQPASTKEKTPAPTVQALKDIPEPTVTATSVDPRKIKDLTPSEQKLLEAQIALEHHESPEIALGLTVELLDDKQVSTEARHTYALAARRLGLHSEFRFWMMKIAQETKAKDWGKTATEALVREVEALEISDMKVLHELVSRYEVETEKNDAYSFYRAKYFLEVGDLGQVEEALKHIPEKSKYRQDALLISALAAYRMGQVDRAVTDLQKLMKESSKGDSLRSIGALTLARLQFQKSQYKDSFQTYLMVERSSPLWLQAMIEQAWAQILVEDHEGAAGNMFSLHTDFFKNAFAPESYTVRTVAYLNLCQFGDGLQVLGNLKKKYAPLVGRLESYKKSKKGQLDHYETVRNWLKNSDLKEVEGLPRSYIVELARHPSFVKVQMQINNFEDEVQNFNKANLALLQKEKDFVKKQAEARADLAKAKDLKAGGKVSAAQIKVDIENLEARIATLKLQHQMANRARGLIKDARVRAQARIEKEKDLLKIKASLALKQRFETLTAELSRALDQNEVLQYEVLAGAGEHLRGQAAGAETETKDRAQMKPGADKSVQWKFKGEIWEDEVGHYRSSLKNVCTKEDRVASY